MWRSILYFFCTTCKQNSSTTVRYAFPLVFLATIAASMAAVISSESSYLSIRPSTTTLTAGETFSIEVYAVASSPVNAIDISVSFPASQIEVTGIDVGESVITLWTEEPSVEGNTILFRGGTFRKGFVGEHFIARINAIAVESGTAKIAVDDVMFLAGDGAGTEVAVSESGEETTKIYIANEDGSMVATLDVAIITDLDGDGEVTLRDVDSFMDAWRSQKVVFDFNGDNEMTFRDFAIILADSFLR